MSLLPEGPLMRMVYGFGFLYLLLSVLFALWTWLSP